MDDTEAMLARFQRRMANANRMYNQAEGMREMAAEIERQLALPDHERPLGHEETRQLEADLLRGRANALMQEANGIQERLHQPDDRLTDEVEAWITRVGRQEIER